MIVERRYRAKLSMSVYKKKRLVYRNDMFVSSIYTKRSKCRDDIKSAIREKLKKSNFFISPRFDYDLVRYSEEASCNTYLRYRIVEEKIHEVKAVISS